MKFLIALPFLAVLAYSSNGGTVSLTPVNDWITSDQVLGIDCYQNGSSNLVLATCSQNSLIRAYDMTTGQPSGVTIPLDSANDYPWGVVWCNDPAGEEYLSNDMVQNFLYFTDDMGVTWATVPNPSNGSGRGMDFDGTDYWITNGGGGRALVLPAGGNPAEYRNIGNTNTSEWLDCLPSPGKTWHSCYSLFHIQHLFLPLGWNFYLLHWIGRLPCFHSYRILRPGICRKRQYLLDIQGWIRRISPCRVFLHDTCT